MPPKRIQLTASGQEIKEKKYKTPPKTFVESEALAEYRMHRDICYYIQHGGECLYTNEEIELVRGIYFKTLF